MTNKNKSYLWFTIASISIIVVWRMTNNSIMTMHDWMRLGIIEGFIQIGMHFLNRKED